MLGSACYDDNSARDSDQAASSTGASAGTDASTGDAPTGTGGESDSDSGDAPDAFVPAEPVLPRLTASQYRNAIEHLLGPGLPGMPLEPDTNPYLFYNIGAATTFLSELGVQQYEEAADALSRAVFADQARREALVGCVPLAPGDGCVQNFIGTFGRRAYRRPLTQDEQARWTDVATQLAEGTRGAACSSRSPASCSRRTSSTASSSASPIPATPRACASPAGRWPRACPSCCGTARPTTCCSTPPSAATSTATPA
ncbi:DUF1587 domain-containing protein [Nannocystis pusilla]|uniref:DUF1587 domain-containing protein n=1 Tax=Nannocystis pusilla TaxID=889268 RepID=UPI003B80030C